MLMGQETLYSISPLIFCGVAELGGAVGAGSFLGLDVEVCTAEPADGLSSSLELVAAGALPPVSTGMGAKPEQQKNIIKYWESFVTTTKSSATHTDTRMKKDSL